MLHVQIIEEPYCYLQPLNVLHSLSWPLITTYHQLHSIARTDYNLRDANGWRSDYIAITRSI